jgi:hypothetical protein
MILIKVSLCRLDITCCHTTAYPITTIILINMTLARLKCKLPDDGRGPKNVGAVLI